MTISLLACLAMLGVLLIVAGILDGRFNTLLVAKIDTRRKRIACIVLGVSLLAILLPPSRVLPTARSKLPTDPPLIQTADITGTVSVTSVRAGADVPFENTIYGQYSDLPADAAIWVLVYAAQRYFVMSNDPASGLPADRQNGQWIAKVFVGTNQRSNRGDVSYLIVVAAEPKASAVLRDMVIQDAQRRDWPGCEAYRLPHGLSEKARVWVRRI